MEKASEIATKEDPALRVCHIDLFNVRAEEEFYSQLATAVIKATSSKWEEALADARGFLSRLVPKG